VVWSEKQVAVGRQWLDWVSGHRTVWLADTGTPLITEVQSVQGMQLADMSTVQCRMCLSTLSAVGFFRLARKATSEGL